MAWYAHYVTAGIVAQNETYKIMASVLLDTHVLLWILTRSKRLKETSWLSRFPRWLISPVTLLELKFLDECGKLQIDMINVTKKLAEDERFIVDDPSLEAVFKKAMDLSWTRDPFDRLLVAHSLVREVPLGTVDGHIKHHCPSLIA